MPNYSVTASDPNTTSGTREFHGFLIPVFFIEFPSRMNSEPSKTPRLRLSLSAAAEKMIRSGHPWVFSDSVREQNREGAAGELAAIFDRNNKFLAIGFYDPDSPIRLRVLHCGKPIAIDSNFWSQRLAAAIAHRQNLFGETTNGYRVINGESDGWPGLVLDRYESTLLLKTYTAAWLQRLQEIIPLVREQLCPERIVSRMSRNLRAPPSWRRESSQVLAGKMPALPGTRFEDGVILFGPPLTQPVTFLENGLRFEADVLRGQKTGFFLDQRENRRIIGSLAKGRSVLNAFSFSGGFSLYAARGGATAVTDLDLSAHALASAERNFALNQSDPNVSRGKHELVRADAFEWLERNSRRKFDLIVLDPPSFAKRESERANAIRAYEKLSALGIACLSRDGILVSCSCSAHVSSDEFFEAVRRAGKKSGRKFSELQTTGHAPDHPATFKEAEYLKAIYLHFKS
jgi:23S rRNA (cytosine1962-C5)-methyltransferase